ncbi:alpha/beta hydrolase family protein [Agrilutibacter solisilvae]|uniref:S9 family peptidase n=1 Tax=Agrilutibacter solisilvae TaxID=2763317 RepID=A0A974XZS9_9GAMM|nr:alpha/beta fold hydrolase [Lysobacter solisilvae]QSX78704.1 S9 family peptidase [Lysobacter solisilvae]
MNKNLNRSAFGRVLALFALLAVSLAAHANLDVVKPGKVPALEPDEGLVVVVVDTHVSLGKVRLMRNGEVFGAAEMSELPLGRTFRLFKAKAGSYAWHDATVGYSFWRLGDDDELKFKVEPGRINYAGDLMFRPGAWYSNGALASANITLANRSLAAIDWLEAQHPALYVRFGLAYGGHYPDPFPDFYKAQRALHPAARAASEVAFKAPPKPQAALPVAVKPLWKGPKFRRVSLNPAGELMALEVREDDEWRVDLIDLTRGSTRELFKSAFPFTSLQWSGDRTLLVSLGRDRLLQTVWAVHVSFDAAGRMLLDRLKFPREGEIVDALPDDPGHVLFSSISGRNELMVHRVDITSDAAMKAHSFAFKDRLNTGATRDLEWVTDGAGKLRLGRIWRNGEEYWIHGRDGAYTDLMKLSGDLGFQPVGLSFDGMRIFAITDTDRGQRDLVVYDIATRRITQTVFTRPGVDVDSVTFDERRNPVAVSYQQQGRQVVESIDQPGDVLGQSLRKAFPGRTTYLASRSRDGSAVAVWSEATDQPMQLHVMYPATGKIRKIDGNTPWLAGVRFAPTQLVSFRAKDGTPLEAFLTLPAGTGKRPLVVLPHGGPIGVADMIRFDPEVQFIASLGYAVLQVNFRGSDAYGKAFREAGHSNYGTGIEDDLDAAVEHVLARHPLDASRMCVVGSSYGGYSGLVAAVRWPERFRCVVSIAGVSDRLLFFTASDSGATKEGRAELEKVMGNPATQLAKMQETSPLYQYEKIQVPVMLAHGVEDRRVDFEHSRRLLRLLDLAGKTPVGLEFAKEGHTGFSADNTEVLYTAVAGFLEQSLGRTATATVDAQPGPATGVEGATSPGTAD